MNEESLQNPDDKTEQNPDDKTEQNPDDKTEQNPDDKTEQNPDDKTEQNPDGITEHESPEEQEAKHPLAEVIDEFVHTILDIRECVQRFVPIASKQLIAEGEETRKLIEKGYALLESDRDTGKEILAIKTIESGIRAAKRFERSNHIKTLIKSLFINLFSAFDKLTGDLLIVLYEKKPELINSVDRKIPLSDALQMGSLDELKMSVLLDEIESVRRKNYIDQFKDMESRFSINLRTFKAWPLFVEFAQRRNLFTHCDGIISSQYMKMCDEVGYKEHKNSEVGDKLDIDVKYFFRACITLTEVGVMLCQTLWRKVIPKELSDADNHLQRLIYDFLIREDLGSAVRLSRFAIDLPNHSDEITRRIILINYAIALYALEKKNAAIKLLDKEDWSAMMPEFKLAVAVLKEDCEEAKAIMCKIGPQGEMINELAYHEWPLFNEFRNTEYFLSAYEEVYEHPYIEKLNEIAEESRKESEEKLAEETKESSNNVLDSDIQELCDSTQLPAD